MTAHSSNALKKFLVLGYGNTLRRDDGVGPKIAEAIAELNLPAVEAMPYPLLTPELAEPLAGADLVVFVDAALDTHHGVEFRSVRPAVSSQVMAHATDPRTLLALARDLFGRAPEAFCLAVPVAEIGIGEELSALAQRGKTEAIEKITSLAANRALVSA